MNAIGTPRQRAVIAAYRMNPKAGYREIALAAGVSRKHAGCTIRDYLESWRRDQALARTTPNPAEGDIARFAQDRRIGGNSGPACCTAKQQKIQIALLEHPRAEGESGRAYSRKIGAIAGTSAQLVAWVLELQRCARIGAECRAREAEAKTKLVPLSLNSQVVGPMPEFRGWADVFSRFKLLAEAYLKIALARQDAYARSFLKDLRDHADRAETRSWLDKSTQ